MALIRRRLRAMEREMEELGAAVIAVCDAADADRLEAATLRTRMSLVERLVAEQHRTIIETNESLVNRLTSSHRSTPLPPPPPLIPAPIRQATAPTVGVRAQTPPSATAPTPVVAQPSAPSQPVIAPPAAPNRTSIPEPTPVPISPIQPSVAAQRPVTPTPQAAPPRPVTPTPQAAPLRPAAVATAPVAGSSATGDAGRTPLPVPTEAADGTLSYLRDVSDSLVRSTANQAVSMDAMRTRQDHLEGRIEEVDQSVAARIASAQAATVSAVDQRVQSGLDELREARIKMATEQARFEIATHDEIAAVIDRFRASS